jgi:hypothetical protein
MLLTEYNEFEYKIEEDVQDKPMRLSGIFQKCSEKNANGRVYGKGLWEKVLSDEKTKRRLKERRILGELDHPKDGKTSLLRAAMVITDLGMQEDGFVRGVYEVLNTPSGQVLRELHRAGVRLGISSRGDGEVEHRKEGQVVIPESYRFETFDVVLDPSVEEAYPSVLKEAIQAARDLEENILTESLPSLIEKFENLSKQVKEACACHVQPTAEVAGGKVVTKENEETPMNVMETQEYKDLAAKLQAAEAKLTSETKRADAATATAEELLIQAKTAQWNVGHMKESLGAARTLGEKYETAKSIIEEMAEELRNARTLRQEMKALRKVAASMYEYIADTKMAKHIQGLLSGVPAAVRESIMPVIESCKTQEEIDAKVKPILEHVAKPAKSAVPAAPKDPAIPSKEQLKESKDGGKPLAEDKIAPKAEEKKDEFKPAPQSGRVIEAMGSGRAATLALTRSLVEQRTRQGLHQK